MPCSMHGPIIPWQHNFLRFHWTIRMHTYAQPGLQELLPGAAAKHGAILAAIKAQDVAQARSLLLEHHRSIEEWFHTQSEVQTTAQLP